MEDLFQADYLKLSGANMKKLLIIPMFFVYYMGMGQTAITIDSASIIGESITIDDIIIAQNVLIICKDQI